MYDYDHSPWPIRDDLAAAHKRAFERLAKPGSWWTGEQRVAIARCARDAVDCALCDWKTDALSPHSVRESHAPSDVLSAEVVDVIHRVYRDANRLTRSDVHAITDSVMSIGQYVEAVAIIANIIAVDSFARILDLPMWPLPDPVSGPPDQREPIGAKGELAWVPTIDPHDAQGEDADLYADQSGAHIHRALSFVPREKHGFFDLDDVMYLPDAVLRDFDNEYRAIDHRQIELLAARVSALNQCHY